jgi:redox-sensing transcriptional repressor
MTYKEFQEKGFKISAVFDRDPDKIGRLVEGIQVMDIGAIVPVIRKRKIKIGILAHLCSVDEA